jgi:hypothetical protein
VSDILCPIPSLANEPLWLVYKLIPNDDGSFRKVPYYANGRVREGELDSFEDRSKLVPFDDAALTVERLSNKFHGIGTAIGPLGDGWHLVGTDIDGVPEEHHEMFTHRLMEECQAFGYALTRSVSGNGFHIYALSQTVLPALRKTPATYYGVSCFVEQYHGGRFFAEGTSLYAPENLEPLAENGVLHETVATARASRPATAPAPAPLIQSVQATPLHAAIARMGGDATKVRNAITKLDPASFNHDDWVMLGMSLRELGDEGFEIWNEWSATDTREEKGYPGLAAMQRTWSSPSFQRPGGITLGTFWHFVKERGSASVEERIYDRDEPALPPASDLIAKLHDGWGREGVPVEPFLVEGLLSCRSGTVLAPGGEGKSTLVTLVAAHIILGRDLFGRPVQKPGAVLYVTGEDDPRDFSETLDRMVRAGWSLTDDERDTIHEGFDLIEGLKLPGAKLVVRDAHGALIPGPLLDVVREALDSARGRYSLVVFDTASTLGLPENEVGQDAAAAFHAYMTQVCREHGVASLLVHHTGKEAARSQLVDQYVGRGASALSDNARLVWQVVRDRGQGARRERAGAQVVEEPKYERPLGITEQDLTDGFTLRVHVHKLRWRPDGEGTDTPFWLVSRGWLPELYPPVPRQEARELRQARREAVDEAGRHSRRERLLSALRAAGEAGGSKNSLGLNGTSVAPGLAVLDELMAEGVVEVFETPRGTRWRLK